MLSKNLERMFHHSAPRFEETRYSINGIEMTRSDVLKVHPTERTVAQWAILVDWDLQRTRQYVVVDPMDPQGLLYLNHAEYLSQMKVCASASLMLIVVARPGSARPVPSITSTSSGSSDDSSQNSPWGVRIESKWSKSSKTSWKQFVTLRNRISRLANRKIGSSMASETHATIARTVYVWVQQLSHWAEVKNPGTYIRYFIPLVLHLEKLLKDNGQMAAVTFLKVSLFVLYSYISGNPLKSTVPLGIGIRLTHGLPRVLDKDLRLLVRKGHMPSIRILASLLNLYRALEAPHPDFSVETIRRSHPVMDGQIWEEFQHFCRLEWPRMLEAHLGRPLPLWEYQSGLYHLVTSAGANATGVAMMAITRDARAWELQPQNHMLNWFRLNGDNEALRMMATSAKEYHCPQEWVPSKEGESPYSQAEILESLKTGKPLPQRDPLGSHPTYSRFFWGTRDRFSTTGIPKGYPNDSKEGVHAPILGRLHAIDEPAGKVRVVAIADYWTQVGMKPVHEHLFNILKDIKQDATFDQTGRVDEYFRENLSPHWSFDLKSATDLIPLALYKEVLTPLFLKKDGSYSEARELIELWSQVLTDRDWLLPDGSGFVRYGTGQPMGALSSWASMAIVHHALVQFSAWRAGRTTWFSSYRVLGDDVDISRDRLVAENYQSSCSAFHIIIGLLKSLRSERNVFEFANQRYCPEGNISPLSYKEELQAQSWSGRLEFARRILARFGTSLSDKAAALIRKAATDTQWRVLHSELSGLRPAVLRSLFGFCLINPFQNWKELTIDSLLEWLLPVLPLEGRKVVTSSLRTTNRLDHFMRVFTTRLLEYTRDQLKTKLASAPMPFAIRPVHHEQPEIKKLIETWVRDYLFLPIYGEKGRDHSMAQEELNRLLTGYYMSEDGSPGYIVQHPLKENLNRNSKFTVLYTIACISKRNEQVIEKMKKLLEQVETSSKYVDHEFMIYFNMKVRNEVMNPFKTAVRYYAEYCELSDIVVPDFGKPMSEWLKTEKEISPASGIFSKALYVRPESEVLPVPGSAIQLALQECFGVTIPGIPLVRMSGLMSSNKGKWMRRLLAAAKSFEENAAVHTALNRYMTRVQREIRWSRRGGRIELQTGS